MRCKWCASVASASDKARSHRTHRVEASMGRDRTATAVDARTFGHATEWIKNAKDATDTMNHTALDDTPIWRSAPHIVAAGCHNHAKIKADVDAPVLSYAKRDIRCLGIASMDTEGKWVLRRDMTFSDLPDVITRAGQMITSDHVANAKETCLVIADSHCPNTLQR